MAEGIGRPKQPIFPFESEGTGLVIGAGPSSSLMLAIFRF